MKGGKREGAGRPPATDKATLLITIKATPAQKAKFLELGGSRWVKRLLDEAQQKQLITKKPLQDGKQGVICACGA